MPFKNRIRLPFYLSKPQFPVERNTFRNAVGATTLLTATVRNTYEGKTDQLPEDWHRKLIIALVHKEVTIEDNRLLTDVVIDGDYGIDWEDFLNKPIAQAIFTIQVTPFNASSNNCQSCSEITQINLVDDYTDDVFEQGQTYEYPDIVIANDSICCFPYTIEIVDFNTNYFNSVTVNDEGVVTFTVNDEVPVLENVLIAIYRVTCESGGYDEANIYGNTNGTGVECLPPTNIQYNPIELDTNLYFSWTQPTPVPAGGYNWGIYLASNPYTPITSGNVTGATLTVPGGSFVTGVDYIFVITSVCGEDDFSTPVTLDFMYETASSNCGNYQFFFVSEIDSLQSISYMDCFGVIQNYMFSYSHAIERCCLESSAGVPVFISASTPDISITYIEPC